MQTENESKIDIEYIKKYILDNRDTITIDYHGDSWIVENSSALYLKANGAKPTVRVSGVGSTLEMALDNFAYWYKIAVGSNKVSNLEDYRDYF